MNALPVTITKTFVSAVAERQTVCWTVNYTVKVVGPASGTTNYTLTDTPAFATAQGVTLHGSVLDRSDHRRLDVTVPATLQPGAAISAGQTHTYNVTATATVNVPAGATLNPCVEGQSGPFYNTATVTFPGGFGFGQRLWRARQADRHEDGPPGHVRRRRPVSGRSVHRGGVEHDRAARSPTH